MPQQDPDPRPPRPAILQEPINLAPAFNMLCAKCRAPVTIPLIVDSFQSLPAPDGPGEFLCITAQGHAHHDCPGGLRN